jgi:hypothetical protein
VIKYLPASDLGFNFAVNLRAALFESIDRLSVDFLVHAPLFGVATALFLVAFGP